MEIYGNTPSKKEFEIALPTPSSKQGASKSLIRSREGDYIEVQQAQEVKTLTKKGTNSQEGQRFGKNPQLKTYAQVKEHIRITNQQIKAHEPKFDIRKFT